ncbi:hypothetical protein [Candidatus Poriferisodalis sp.]|uniref:hypothetical protein n=1 Tax=Candidatus Poriferisodalis sp. TaxID=3101277 RepID=UPI003B02B507
MGAFMSNAAPIRLDTPEGVELLAAHGSRVEVSISDDLREHSDCPEIRLESVFAEAKPYLSLAFVHRVDLDAPHTSATPASVVKYSARRHSAIDAECIKLGTAQYYRDYPGDATGIRDPDEARYVESLRSSLAEWNPDALDNGWLRHVIDGSVAYQGDGSWFFCASTCPRTQRERAALENEFEADCMTDLGHPAGFAQELASAFAQMAPAPPAALGEWLHRLQEHALRTQTNFERVVHVCHGPVVYTNDHERHIKHLPVQHRASAFAFVKHPRFARQREYRFTVSTIGKPAQDELLVRNTQPLKDRSTIVP